MAKMDVYRRSFAYKKDAEAYALEIRMFPVRQWRVRGIFKSVGGTWDVEYETDGAGAFGVGDKMLKCDYNRSVTRY